MIGSNLLRARPRLLALLVSAVLFLTAAPAGAQDGSSGEGGDDNEATAINTEDGGTVFDFALSVRRVADGVVDQTNTATAAASCTDCSTVAAAFQVVLVYGDADVVVPENLAVAVNSECAECFTYAAATQIVIGADGMQLTAEGQRRLAALQKDMRDIERNADQMTDAELAAAVQGAETELVAIFDEELVPVGAEVGNGPADTTTSTTSTIATDGVTTTTSDGVTTTSGAPTTTEGTTTTLAAA